MGQTAMAPAGGLLGGASAATVNGFRQLNDNGPGWLYYGINAADKGLGYRGSYMTLGGFFPAMEDDLGGFWAADLRGHLSQYGGFFSNVGVVRKQLIGGTLLGVGVYWDYDGDQNQYDTAFVPTGGGNTYAFAGGYSYNQVGVSGEWLTDYGNLRSNGYIPVGTTAELVGPRLQNTFLCVNGVNAALGGADLEVGAYVPGLTDWAGMISVGGYALGNTSYQFSDGSDAVPWFGGVYTRLDLTFLRNWDFSLQYNNDSYFDSTGFARITYRMGSSRRRTVPDQMEQPMMRNEHIIRARQIPVVATNPQTGQPWRVFYVDNSAAPGSTTGMAEAPFTTLEQAQTAATQQWDVVYVDVGVSQATPYITPVGGYSFNQPNQYFLGEGTAQTLPTLLCGNKAIPGAGSSSLYPVITNPLGPAIVVDQPGSVVSHFQIIGSPVGISDGTGIVTPGVATVSDVIIDGGSAPLRRGIEIANSTGRFDFDRMQLRNLTNDGLVVSAAEGNVSMTNSSFTDVGQTAIRVSGSAARVAVADTTISGTTTITGIQAAGPVSQVSFSGGSIDGVVTNAVVASGSGARVDVAGSRISNVGDSALVTTGQNTVVTATNATISGVRGSAAILVQGAGSQVRIDNTRVTDVTGNGAIVSGSDATFTMTRASRMQAVGGNGISVTNSTAFARVLNGSQLSGISGDGVALTGGAFQIVNSTIENVSGAGISATNATGPTTNPLTGGSNAVWVQGAKIQNATDGGVVTINSDLRVERAVATNPSSTRTSINNTGLYGIRAVTNSGTNAVLVDAATIGGVSVGIGIQADAGAVAAPPTIQFTATDNQITAATNGIAVSAVWDNAVTGQPLSRVNAEMTGNNIAGTAGDGILLTSVGGPLLIQTPDGPVLVPNVSRPISIAAGSIGQLGLLNFNTTVGDEPANVNPGDNINFNPGIIPPQPPLPPAAP
jgi:hypothetical protein